MRRILCATDFLPKSEAAIERAAMLAQQFGGDLSLLHVVSPASSERIFEESLQLAMAGMKSRVRPPMWRHEVTPETRVRAGNPARLIMDTIEQLSADLLVLGPHRKRGPLDALAGTIAEKVLSSRKCPVLVAQREAASPYTQVLLALDLSSESPAVAQAAGNLVRTAGAQVSVLHAWHPPYKGMLRSVGVSMNQILAYSQYSNREVATEIRQLLAGEGVESNRFKIDIVDAHAVPAITRAIDMYQPDLLILGTRGHGRLRRALLGSVSNRLLSSVECDVLIVPRSSVEAANVQGVQAGVMHGNRP